MRSRNALTALAVVGGIVLAAALVLRRDEEPVRPAVEREPTEAGRAAAQVVETGATDVTFRLGALGWIEGSVLEPDGVMPGGAGPGEPWRGTHRVAFAPKGSASGIDVVAAALAYGERDAGGGPVVAT